MKIDKLELQLKVIENKAMILALKDLVLEIHPEKKDRFLELTKKHVKKWVAEFLEEDSSFSSEQVQQSLGNLDKILD